MANVQLIIDNQIADVYSGNDLITSVTYSISDINDIDKRGNSTSKTIKIPATSKNKKIFGFADDLTVTSFKGQKTSMIGIIREGGTDILVGVVNLKSFQQTAKDSYFEVTIIGNCGEWIDTMTNGNLRDIGTEGSHEKNASNINYSIAAAGTLPYIYGLINDGFAGGQVRISEITDNGEGYCVCEIDGSNTVYNLRENLSSGIYAFGINFDNSAYNKKMFVGSVIADDLGNQKVLINTTFMGGSSGTLRSANPDLRVEDRPLMVNIEKALTKMFALSGYRISSDFINSSFFKKLYILPGNEQRSESWCTEKNVTAGKIAPATYSQITTTGEFQFNTILTGNSGMFNISTFRFVATEGMMVVFKAQFNMMGTTGYEAYAKFSVNGNVGYGGQINRNTNVVKFPDSGYVILTQEAELRLKSGDYVTVQIMMPAIDGDSGDMTVSNLDTFLECIIQPNVINGSSIEPYKFLPDVTQIEFVKAIRHLFNLYFFTDVNTKTVYIEPRDTFYRRDKFIDWSEMLDLNQQLTFEELGADLSKKITFRYKEDGADIGVQEWNSVTGLKFSSHSVDLNNKFGSKDEKVIENNLFAPTMMGTFDYAGLTKSMAPKIWGAKIDKDPLPERLKEFLPRILYFAGMRDCKVGESFRFEGVTYNEYPLFCSYDNDITNDYSLLFQPQPTIPDMFFRYYSNYIRTLNEGRKITAFMNLKTGDLQALNTPDINGELIKDFRSQVFIRHNGEVVHCRLESINDYSAGLSRSTKVVLITDVDNFSQQVTPFVYEMDFVNDNITASWIAGMWHPASYANVSIMRTNTFWSDCRNGSSGSSIGQYPATGYGVGSSGTSWGAGPYRIERAFLFFDTSDIPDGATIIEAYLDIYKVSGSFSLEVAVFEGLQINAVTPNQFQAFGTEMFGESVGNTYGLKRIYLNSSGIAKINKSGWTKYCLRDKSFDVPNVAPAAGYDSFKTNMVNSPVQYLNKLNIKYTM